MTIDDLSQKLIKFRDDRDWAQFHNPKDVAISLNLEAAELLEHFQWKNDDQLKAYLKTSKEEISDELADVFNWVLIMAHDLDIDILGASSKKIDKNALKYPIEKAKGNSKKYTELN